MANSIAVGLGEIKTSRDPDDILVAYGLGSCLGIGMQDPVARVAGLLHAVLPYHTNGTEARTGKFVDSGLQALLAQLTFMGANPARMVIRMAGGANMLIAPGFSTVLNIGSRNIEAAYTSLAALKLKIASKEVGGNTGRTVRFYVSDGRMTIRTMGNQEREV